METDALGGRPLTLVQLLRLVESDIHGWKKQKKAGQEYTIPTISNDGEITEPQPLDDLISNWEEGRAHLEKVITWAESKEPGSSRKESGNRLIEEYESLFEKD